jgi:hypothetical protein
MVAKNETVTPAVVETPPAVSELMRRMAMTLESYVVPIYDGTWLTTEDESVRTEIVDNLRALHAFTGKLRQHFDDTLKIEHKKGNLLKVDHIRQPKTVVESTPTLASFFDVK